MERVWKRAGAVLLALLLLSGCAPERGAGESPLVEPTGSTAALTDEDDGGTLTVTEVGDYTVEYTAKDTDASVASGARTIRLDGDRILFDGTASLATVSGSTITITAGGTYVVSGTLNNGQILINEPGDETVRLVLNGANITCSTSAPIYILEAKKVVLVLAEGTENIVSDSAEYTQINATTGEPNAAIFSKADLSITGTGALTVNANYNNGINSKDKLKITAGTVTVTAAGNGIKGKDCVAIAGGVIDVTAERDGIKSTNGEEVDAGFVRIDGGAITVTAGQDGIQAETGMVLAGGTVTVSSGGGSVNASTTSDDWGHWGSGGGFPGGSSTASSGDTTSAKGLKASLDMTITGGALTVDSSDDALHSNGSLTIAGGTVSLTSGDDGVHADNALTICGGEIAVSKAYEGLEALAITIAGGITRVTASDDGINAAGGNDGSSINGRPGQNPFASTEGAKVEITDGYLLLNAGGDGLDSNADITMTGGTVLVYGPTNSGNGAIDFASGFTMSGGTLVAAGSSGMAESITGGDSSAIFLTCATQAAGTPVRVEDGDGGAVITVAPEKAFSSVVIVTPQLKRGEAFTVYVGGSVDGAAVDGLYGDCDYTAGELSATVTLSKTSTALDLGGSSGMGGFGGGMGRPGGMGRM